MKKIFLTLMVMSFCLNTHVLSADERIMSEYTLMYFELNETQRALLDSIISGIESESRIKYPNSSALRCMYVIEKMADITSVPKKNR